MIAVLALAAALRAGGLSLDTPADAEYRLALELLYDGRADDALSRLRALEAAHPGDPVGAYAETLVMAWTVEQRPESAALDHVLEMQTTRGWEMADALLRAEPADARARFARAAASAMRSRYHLFRAHRSEAAQAAVKMREDLLVLAREDPDDADVSFGLGLYDYYADVLPRYAKLLRWLARMPGGNRARGLAEIERAKERSVLHRTEAQVQLYEIHAFYEDEPERALDEIADLHQRYPGWPLWALKLAEHLRDRMGAYAESAQAARSILASEHGPGAAPGPGALALARLSLGETLLADLRPAEARRVLLPVKDGLPGNPALGAQARLLLGRSLELEGDREGALAHYRIAAASADREGKKRAQAALAQAMPPSEVRARQLLAEARREREGGRFEEAAERYREALAAWPRSTEAALGAAEDDLRAGRAARAKDVIPDLDEVRPEEPPWLRSWGWLLVGRLRDLEGDREAAVLLYKKVLKASYRRDDLRAAATAGVRSPFRPDGSGGD